MGEIVGAGHVHLLSTQSSWDNFRASRYVPCNASICLCFEDQPPWISMYVRTGPIVYILLIAGHLNFTGCKFPCRRSQRGMYRNTHLPKARLLFSISWGTVCERPALAHRNGEPSRTCQSATIYDVSQLPAMIAGNGMCGR